MDRSSLALVLLVAAATWATDLSAADKSPAQMLQRANELYTNLQYDEVIPIVTEVLQVEALPIEQRLDAYFLQGACLAIVGNTVDAEKPFRFLLRGRPDYDMSADTPPRILQVFRKVQVEENAIRDQMAELEHKSLVQSIVVDEPALGSPRGGLPLRFDVAVRDPRGGVGRTSVLYRKAGAGAFSSLALEQRASGRWGGELPGEWTANDSGFVLEYFIKTTDARGKLLVQSAPEAAPRTVDVAPGNVDDVPFYSSMWFWGATGVAAVALAGSAITVGVISSQPPAGDLPAINIDR